MTTPLLSIRINRRAIAVVALQNETVVIADGRNLSSRTGHAVPSAVKFVGRLIELTRPSAVVVDAPTTRHGSTTRGIVDALEALSRDRHLPFVRVVAAEVLVAYGNPPLDTREELRQVVGGFWSEVAHARGAIRRFLIDAAAVALFADCRRSLETTLP